jgi:hypothetical protein
VCDSRAARGSDRRPVGHSMSGRLERRLLSEPSGGRSFASAPCSPRREEWLGLHETDLATLAVRCHFGKLAQHFRPDGGAMELREIAWWGSALADIASEAAAQPRDEDVLSDAALFNLGVALFDGVVDHAPERIPAIAESLSPVRLRQKLERPSDPDAALTCADPQLELIVSLFDHTLGRVGQRCAGDPAWRDRLARTLRDMYASELGLNSEPLAAKTLPLVFLGHLVIRPSEGEGPAREFFAHLSAFLALWDDWVDLGADALALAPNAFLGSHPSKGWVARMSAVARGVALAAGEVALEGRVSRRLSATLDATLESARRLPPAARDKTRNLCLRMLRVAPVASACL